MKVKSRQVGMTVLFTIVACIFFGSMWLGPSRAAKPAETATPRHSQHRKTSFELAGVSHLDNASIGFEEREDTLFDGVRRFVRTYQHARPELLFLVLTKDASSWGYEFFKPIRTFHDFLSLLNSTQLDLEHVSLGIMTSSEEEYRLYRNATAATPLPRVTILLKQSESDQDKNLYTSVPRGGRHSHAIQTARRSSLAALRNELMNRALHDERHIVWIDSDIRYLSPGLVQAMLFHAEAQEDASIITARCRMGWNPDYDANSWAGRRLRGPSSGRTADPTVSQEDAEIPQKHVKELIWGTNDSDIIRLDSVGGTILYVRASLVHQGLVFPPYYVIGTRWGEDGWDGLETEGLCYISRYLRNGGCYVLGGTHEVQHTSH